MYLNTSLVQLKKNLCILVDNLVTNIKNENIFFFLRNKNENFKDSP